MTYSKSDNQRRIAFWQNVNLWDSQRRHETPYEDGFREDSGLVSRWGRWVSGKYNANNDADDIQSVSSVIGKPFIDSTATCRLDGHAWDDIYTWTGSPASPRSAKEAQRHFVDYTVDRLAHRNPNQESIVGKTTRLNSSVKIPIDYRHYPDEIFYFPTHHQCDSFSNARMHIGVEDLYCSLAECGWGIRPDKADVTLFPDYVDVKVVEQAYVILDVTDDRVLLMPWLYQQGQQYEHHQFSQANRTSLHLYETFLLSVSRVVIESLKSEDIKVGGIVVHARDRDLRKTTHHASDYMPATWKGVHAENGVYDLCMLGNNAQTQGAIFYCLPAFDKGLADALDIGPDYSCNLFSETGLSLLAEEPLSFINVCDGIEMMHNNFTISTDRHESSKPDLPKWVDTWQDKRKTIQVDLRKANERSSGGRSIITRCVECNQKAYIITPTPNPDIGSADCPTCRGKGTLHFQNLLDGAELQSEFPMAGRR